MGVAVGEQSAGTAPPRQTGEPVPSRPRTEAYHVSGRHFDHDLGCLVSRGLGFSWRCTCGARGRLVADRAEALAGKREHEEGHRA